MQALLRPRNLVTAIIVLVAAACVKRSNDNPYPVIEYRDFQNARKTPRGDTAVLVLGYEDGDGDLFVDRNSQGPNLIFTTNYVDPATGLFTVTIDPQTKDTLRYTSTIRQPDNGYYKGKSIKGEIFIPMNQFRPSSNIKVLRFTGFMNDLAGHRSNSFSSPVFTLDF